MLQPTFPAFIDAKPTCRKQSCNFFRKPRNLYKQGGNSMVSCPNKWHAFYKLLFSLKSSMMISVPFSLHVRLVQEKTNYLHFLVNALQLIRKPQYPRPEYVDYSLQHRTHQQSQLPGKGGILLRCRSLKMLD